MSLSNISPPSCERHCLYLLFPDCHESWWGGGGNPNSRIPKVKGSGSPTNLLIVLSKTPRPLTAQPAGLGEVLLSSEGCEDPGL